MGKKYFNDMPEADITALLASLLSDKEGLLKANGEGVLSIAEVRTDYMLPNVSINDQVGTSYTLVLADAGKYVRCTNENAIAVTVPTNAAVAYNIGTVITIEQGDAGVITVAGDTDVTVNGYDSGLSTAGQYAVIQLLKTGSDAWTCIGGIAV